MGCDQGTEEKPAVASLCPEGTDDLLYVGTYTNDIYRVRVGHEKIEVIGKDPSGGFQPSFLTRSKCGRYLYAALEWGSEATGVDKAESGAVASYRIEAGGALTLLNIQKAEGPWSCYVDTNGSYLFVANYGGGVASFPIQEDGSLLPACDVKNHEGPLAGKELPGQGNRQDGSHSHCITVSPDGKSLAICDLGLDRIFQYRIGEDGKLEPASEPFVQQAAGCGPRHICFSPSGKHAFAIRELDNHLVVFDFNQVTGTLTEKQAVQTCPSLGKYAAVTEEHHAGDFNGEVSCGADVHVHPSGKYVYASNRGDDSISAFSINEADGTAEKISGEKHDGINENGNFKTNGVTPRNFFITPAGAFMIVANQNSDKLQAFAIAGMGELILAPQQECEVKWPVCVCGWAGYKGPNAVI